jgi:RNA polymerase sigma-70 factor (ECF subfamily)
VRTVVSPDELLHRARNGDQDAFSDLWRSLNPILVRYLQVRAPAVAEDAAAETWLAVVEHLSRFSGDARAFRSYLFTIARSKVADSAREWSRRPKVLVDDWEGLEPAADVDVAREAISALETESVLRLLRTLPGDQAEIVALRVLGDLDASEVAQVVGKSVGAVRVAQHRAFKRLVQLVERAGVMP